MSIRSLFLAATSLVELVAGITASLVLASTSAFLVILAITPSRAVRHLAVAWLPSKFEEI